MRVRAGALGRVRRAGACALVCARPGAGRWVRAGVRLRGSLDARARPARVLGRGSFGRTGVRHRYSLRYNITLDLLNGP